MTISPRVAGVVLAGSLALSGAATTFAAKAHTAPTSVGFAYGQVSNLSATGFTLTRTPKNGGAATVVQVTVTNTTKERARKGTTGALSNQEYAMAIGPRSTAGITARRVLFSSKPFNAARLAAFLVSHRVAGTVTGSTGTTISIQTKNGRAYTFNLVTATRFRVAGKLQAIAPAFTVGERVVVLFTRDRTTNALVARAVGIRATQPAAA